MAETQESKGPANRLSPSGRANVLMVAISLGFLIVALSCPRFAARGQHYGMPPKMMPEMPEMPHTMVPITPPAIPIPSITKPPVVVTTDVTNPHITNPRDTSVKMAAYVQSMQTLALAGIELASDKTFPGPDKVGKNFDWITVLAKDGAVYTKPNNYTADLKNGDIIVSVKTPSHLAFVNTPYGEIALGANADAMITYNQGILRLLNFDGEGRVLKIRLDKGPFAGVSDPTVSIAAGYELIASDKIITRAEMRPRDGIARRFGQTLEKGHLAICQFSLESAAHNVAMLINLQQSTTGIKERRILADLSKMAAVLNYRSGEQGYTVEK